MSKIIVLGGCGVVGSVVVRTLSTLPDFTNICIGDINIRRAQDLVKEIDTVLPPEACINPLDFLGIMREYLDLDTTTGGESPLIIESIDEKENIEQLNI
ncbi:MAG: hypothetical protein ACFE95_18670 [Candidatus Hodarchaeota archaeon]